MKIFKFTLLALLAITAMSAQSQTLRLVGYQGEVVLTNGATFAVSGATLSQCEEAFDQVVDEQTAATGEAVFYGRSGTQHCTPNYVYRSPSAPSTSLSSAAKIIPQIPGPPTCLSCLVFEHPNLIKDLYPDHHQLVEDYVKTYKIDQYNKDLRDLQNQYQANLAAFEKDMFALEEYLSTKDK
ncbi:hypothetical protein [Marinicella litoralis]|nr:hypothetical protein [Marinicella litoralis]